MIDVVQYWSWVQVGSKKIEQPEPFPRPGTGPARTQLSHREIGERLRAQQRGR